jgi:3-oxoacyl-[acyl-carrier protein] reductase/(S)-1-phenylethanol dehydrogenase
VTVNAVAASLTRTPGTENSPAKDIFDSWRKGQAIDRLEQPDDLVGAVSFFCSDDAAFITDQLLMVDGGMVRAG